MLEFDFIQSIVVILLLFVIGEIVSTKTKAFVPSVFVVAVLFLIGFWTDIIPKDIIDRSGFSALGIGAMLVIVVHMGTMLSIEDLLENWKTVIISLMSLVGLVGFLLVIGSRFLDWQTVVVATPPLAGGMTAAIIMQTAAAELGMTDLSVLAITVYVVQGFVGYPLTSLVLKREANRLLENYGIDESSSIVNKKEIKSTRLIPSIPEKYQTIYSQLLTAYLTVWVAARLEGLTGGAVSRYVFCLFLGVIFSRIGLLEKNHLDTTQSYGMFVTTAMSMVFAGLSLSTPEMFKSIIVPLSVILVVGVSGLFIFSVIAGKILKFSWEMSFAIALNALYGFPPNMILTTEVINSVTDNEEKRKYLEEHMMSKMLIGGFVSVTITSTLLAGIFINFL